MVKLKMIQKELNIVPTSLRDWLKIKLDNEIKTRNSWSYQWEVQWDK